MNKLSIFALASGVLALGLLTGCPAPAAPPTPTVAPAKPTVAVATPAALATPTTAPAKPAVTTPSPALATPAARTPTPAALSGRELASAKFCARCHGANGEGGFGPPLAGTQATSTQAIAQVRNPRANMPRFIERQISDAEISSIVDYYKSLSRPATPAAYQFSVQPADPAGQKVFVENGCAACHGIPPNVAGTKLTAPEEITQVRTPRGRMGAFNPTQISDADITTVNEWLRSLPPPPTPTPAAGAAPQPSPTR